MRDYLIEAATTTEAYREVLQVLVNRGSEVPCQRKQTRELLGVTIKVEEPIYNLPLDPARRFNYRYMIGEAMWNLCPRADTAFLLSLSKGISKFVEDQPAGNRKDARWAYGPQIHPDLAPLISLLKEHPETRRAVLRPGRMSRPAERGSGTPPCLEFVEFLLRGDFLHCVSYMRSNDAFLGMPYDMFTYTLWQQALATALGKRVGSYTHMVGSLHYYLADEKKVMEVAFGNYDTDSIALEEKPNLAEAVGMDLSDDLDRCMYLLNSDPSQEAHDHMQGQFRAKSWIGLLSAVCKHYDHMDPALQLIENRKIGIGW